MLETSEKQHKALKQLTPDVLCRGDLWATAQEEYARNVLSHSATDFPETIVNILLCADAHVFKFEHELYRIRCDLATKYPAIYGTAP